ncbi:MAG: methylated-DNA--[protein]-cysteine S-methyltransferase [Nitrospiraceae bacterium]|nr:methylated-DNA--[protein]-cysteine S-methyltransferase [Nitrospiraceae bacterium]
MKQRKTAQPRFFDSLDTPLGSLYLVFSGPALTGISFDRPAGIELKKTADSGLVKKELMEYFANAREEFTCMTAFIEGTKFEKKVWELIREIPYGETRTYKWVAEKIGEPHAFRAVGNALGKNPIPIVFPCHRVIESSGSIGGYSSGVRIKQRLLEIEYYTKTAGPEGRQRG